MFHGNKFIVFKTLSSAQLALPKGLERIVKIKKLNALRQSLIIVREIG